MVWQTAGKQHHQDEGQVFVVRELSHSQMAVKKMPIDQHAADIGGIEEG